MGGFAAQRHVSRGESESAKSVQILDNRTRSDAGRPDDCCWHRLHFGDSCPRRAQGWPTGRLDGGRAFGLKLLRLTQYVAVSLCCCTAVLEADIMQQASGTCVQR